MARYSVDYDGDLSTTDDRVSYRSFDAATNAINDRGFNSFSIQDNRRGGGGNLGSFSGEDRVSRGFSALNEARPVRQGFASGIGNFMRSGGLLGSILGRGQVFGYNGPQGAVSPFVDMINGGGAGMAGDTFEGGLLSGVLNSAGVRPLGYQARQGQAMMTPQQVRAQMGNAPSVMAPPPVSTPSTAYRPAAQPSPMPEPMPTRLPINMQGMVQGSGQTPATGYVQSGPAPTRLPVNMQGMVRGSGQTPATGYVPQAAPAPAPSVFSPAANQMTLPRSAPSIGDLEAYLSGQPNAALAAPTQPPMPSRSAVQDVAPRPYVGRPDLGTLRPFVSSRGRTSMPMQGFTPDVNTLSRQATRIPINMQGVVSGSGQTPATGYMPSSVPSAVSAPRTAYERMFGINQYGILGR